MIDIYGAVATVGFAYVVDGDTLRVNGERTRLFGIDAPEHDQHCGPAACGDMAKLALVRLIANRPVRCEGDQRDRYGRLLATCTVGGQDLGRWMVVNGYAQAYVRYSRRYLAEETRARRASRGLWAYGFGNPEEFRRGAQNRQ